MATNSFLLHPPTPLFCFYSLMVSHLYRWRAHLVNFSAEAPHSWSNFHINDIKSLPSITNWTCGRNLLRVVFFFFLLFLPQFLSGLCWKQTKSKLFKNKLHNTHRCNFILSSKCMLVWPSSRETVGCRLKPDLGTTCQLYRSRLMYLTLLVFQFTIVSVKVINAMASFFLVIRSSISRAKIMDSGVWDLGFCQGHLAAIQPGTRNLVSLYLHCIIYIMGLAVTVALTV